jgi:hypothetical protein
MQGKVRNSMSKEVLQWIDACPREDLPTEDCPSNLLEMIRNAARGKGQHSDSLLRWAFPSTSGTLAARETYDIVLAARVARKHNVKLTEQIIMSSIGLGSQCVARVLLTGVLSPEGRRIAEGMLLAGWTSWGLRAVEELGKCVHEVVRSSGLVWVPRLKLEGGSPDRVMYMHLLSGRYDFRELDVSAALLDRGTLNPPKGTHTKHGFDTELFASRVEEIMAQDRLVAAKRIGRRQGQGLDVFLANYSKFGASGSCKRMRGKLSVLWRGEEHEVDNPSKMAWLASLGPQDLVEVVYEVAETGVRTTGVRKMESGKLRMLLPGPEAHWLVETMALLDSENQVFRMHKEIELEKTRVDSLHSLMERLRWVTEGMHVAAEDFDDYNILHDHSTMAADYRKLAAEIMVQTGIKESEARHITASSSIPAVATACCLVMSEAMHDMWARDMSKPDEWVHQIRGLWTGWRSTMWFNTRFNRAYSHAVQRGVEEEYGFRELEHLYLVGDDSLLASPTEYETLRRLEAYDLSGLKSQASKQMADDEQAELTRIMHRSDGTVSGSLMRAICNGASGDMQGMGVNPGPHMAQSLKSQLQMWVRRGADYDVVETCRREAIGYWVHLRIKDDAGKVQSKRIPLQIVESDERHGGLGLCPVGEIPARLVEPVLLSRNNFRSAVTKNVAAQWDVSNASRAADHANRRFWQQGYSLDKTRAEHCLVEGVYGSNQPMQLMVLQAQSEHGDWAEAISEWERRGGASRGTQPIGLGLKAKVDVASAWGLLAVDGMRRQLVRRVPDKLVRRWEAPWSRVNTLEAVALGTAAGAPSVLNDVRVKGRRVPKLSVVRKMCARHRTLPALMSQVGTALDSFVNGRIDRPQSVGLIAPKHMVLVDLALTEGMRKINLAEVQTTHNNAWLESEEGGDFLRLLNHKLEWAIKQDPYWGPQQGY